MPESDYLSQDLRDEEGYFDDDIEPTPFAFCDVYTVHDAHSYWAINHSMYMCRGLHQEDLDEMEALAAMPPCVHGMSAQLCAGPNHYPADR